MSRIYKGKIKEEATVRIYFHGHSCFEIEGEAGRILIDPYLKVNASAKAKPAGFTQLDAILVSHGHNDHFGDAVLIAKKTGATIIGVDELAKYCQKQGAKAHAMHIGGKYRFPFGVVKLTPAFHGSGIVDPEGGNLIYGGLPCGFLIQMDGKNLYHAGDTALFGDMALIGRNPPLDVAMLPIGDNFGMGIEDAAQAAQLLRAKEVIPMHYNTFPLIAQDVGEFEKLLQQKAPDSRPKALKPGEMFEL